MIKIYDRANKKYIDEEQFGQGALNFLYNNALGRIILKIAVNPVISKLIGAYKKSRISKRGIKSLIKDYDIDMSLYEEKEYKSFNDFFTRKIKLDKRPMIDNDNYFISPADSKVIAYDISKTNTFTIKGTEYTLNELVKDNVDLSDFQNGLCLVFRLSLDNYHHYCYPDTGKLETTIKIKGKPIQPPRLPENKDPNAPKNAANNNKANHLLALGWTAAQPRPARQNKPSNILILPN